MTNDDRRLLIEAARADLNDTAYADFSLRAAVSTLAPTAIIKPDWTFGVVDLGKDGFIIDTNVDFEYLDREYKKVEGQEEGGMTPALITPYLFSTRADCYCASTYMSGYVCDLTTATLMKRKFLDLICRRERDAAEIDLFQDQVLPEGKRIREAINSGEAPFEDIIPLLHKARKFKGWLASQNPDESLLKEYFKEVSKTTWLETLPGKTFRWITAGGLSTAAGFAFSPIEGSLAGLGLGAIDTFWINRLLRGWRPDQFVDAALAQFVERKQ